MLPTLKRNAALHGVWALCLWVATASAQVAIPITSFPFEKARADVAPELLVFINEIDELSYLQVWDSLRQSAFQTLPDFKHPGVFEIGQYQYWIAFVLENRSVDSLDLVITSIWLDTLWIKRNNGLFQQILFPGWFPHPDPLGLLPYDLMDRTTFRLYPGSRDTLLLTGRLLTRIDPVPRLSHLDAYESHRVQSVAKINYLLMWSMGATLSVLFFAFAQYFQHRDLAFLWYGFYLLALMLNGWQSFEDRNPDFYFSYYLLPAFWTKMLLMASYFVAYSYFIFYFLPTRTAAHRKIQRIVISISAIVVLLEILLLFNDLLVASRLLYFGYRIVILLFSFGALVFLWRQRTRLTNFIFVGTACLMICEFYGLFLPRNAAFVASCTGIGLEMLFFSLGLAYRSRLFRESHNRLQIRHIRQLEENERLREIERREEVEAFKNRFYANITHEFRTPLTVMLGMAESLRINDNPDAREAGKLVERNGHNLLRLVNQLLDLSKIESGALQLHPVHADVMKFVKVTAESFESLAAIKKQHLRVQTQPAEFFMDFDPDRLQQVLSNLIGNALKFTPEAGEISVICSVDASPAQPLSFGVSTMMQIEVRDTGIGISEEALPHIHNRFYRGDDSAASQTQGTGIGLALVKELLVLMRGKLEVESRIGEGSVFRVWIPFRDEERGMRNEGIGMRDEERGTRIGSELVIDPHSSSLIPHPWLLLVEDNPDLVHYLRSILSHDYQLLTAGNGHEGLAQAFEHLPDIVLSDVMMPGMDGLEFCRTLKKDQRTSHIPVVMLTARAAVGDKIHGLQHGADAWLTKPFDREELFATLAAMLESRRRLRAYFENENGKGASFSIELAPLVQKENEFLHRVRAFVDAHLDDEDYDISQLCQDLAMSRMQLHRKLTALGAPSAALFIREHRLSQAQILLKTTDLTVSEVAFKTGFSDPAYFTRCFREAFGKSPSTWRNE